MTNSVIESFINKFKLAQSSKSKDIRITVEEAGDLINAIASINSDRSEIERLSKKIDALSSHVKNIPLVAPNNGGVDGGGFKG